MVLINPFAGKEWRHRCRDTVWEGESRRDGESSTTEKGHSVGGTCRHSEGGRQLDEWKK